MDPRGGWAVGGVALSHRVPSRWQEATAVISARRSEEVTLEGLRRVLAQLEPPAPRPPRRTPQDTPELVVSGGLAGAMGRGPGGPLVPGQGVLGVPP